MSSIDEIWNRLDTAMETALSEPLVAKFTSEPQRAARLGVDTAGIHFDFAKTHLDAGVVDAFCGLADAAEFDTWREKLLTGSEINLTETRAATHTAERGTGNAADVAAARDARETMKALYGRVADGAFGAIDRVIHIGIGGSFLGPALLIDALPKTGPVPDVRIVSNIDAVALERTLQGADPDRTLVVTVSKSFTTLETMMNMESCLAALEEMGGTAVRSRLVAVTAAPDKAEGFGVDPQNILPFAETVGGRYSLWTGVSLAAALALGWDAFEDVLAGAAAMDRHFAEAPLGKNAPALGAMMDLGYSSLVGAESRAVFAYDERLRLLPDFLQQLETESNGKRVDRNGRPLTRASSPIVWGGVGTDAQHAVFQMLHQGTHLVPTEFLAVVAPGHGLGGEHHRQLLANCIAQGAALMRGRSYDEAMNDAGDSAMAQAKTFEGGRPSSTILLDRLDARTLGALIAFYEHRTFSFGAFLGINSFDQMGVELGKEVARTIAGGDLGDLDASSRDLLSRAGIS
ncbi:glucose-6-phosphate isomerase [Pacificimonas flava]|uniref:Glucose-6-phosphate isomerase n=1 Tax=Pacificimonas flava TaxID=1234595 RepID=M2SGJ5_9SPHN|nr:glucose-6-phosphate isomerase [Pacificimonas flava]EMD84495.1 Glucose-6-phosphate isomerase [Pacificimonas flava]MBB5279633.1 glucose-6-phosphate isomerase [Pacificimonas flava]